MGCLIFTNSNIMYNYPTLGMRYIFAGMSSGYGDGLNRIPYGVRGLYLPLFTFG